MILDFTIARKDSNKEFLGVYNYPHYEETELSETLKTKIESFCFKDYDSSSDIYISEDKNLYYSYQINQQSN